MHLLKPVRTDLLLCDIYITKQQVCPIYGKLEHKNASVANITENEKLQMQQDVGIADQQRSGRHSKDDSIKKVQYTTTPYISLMGG